MISAKFIRAALVGEVFGSERCDQAACQRSGAFASAPVMIDAWMAARCRSGVVHPDVGWFECPRSQRPWRSWSWNGRTARRGRCSKWPASRVAPHVGVEDRCHILMIAAGHDDISDELADVPAIVAASTNLYSSCPSADSLPCPARE